jgi:hypothetical protein
MGNSAVFWEKLGITTKIFSENTIRRGAFHVRDMGRIRPEG